LRLLKLQNIPSEYLETNEGNIKIFFSYFSKAFKTLRLSACTQLVLCNKNFRVVITIDGSRKQFESIVKKYKDISSIDFIGLIKRESL
jgi:hypothetical protein